MKPASSFLSQPVRSLQTMLRGLAKAQPERYDDLIPDGIYGPQTRQAVRRFQTQQALPVTGVTDQATWEALSALYQAVRPDILPAQALFIRVLPCGSMTEDSAYPCLYLVQAMLLAMAEAYGVLPVPPLSGTLDSGTREALEGFQRLCSLPVTGRPDKTTWKHLVFQFTLLAELRPGEAPDAPELP